MTPRNCFLAMFDIIGFKALRNEIGTAGLFQKYKRGIQPMIEHSASGKGKAVEVRGKKLYVPDFSNISVKYKIISDSTILYTDDDSFSSFISIIHSSFMLLQSGFSGAKAPYRGAIAHGDLIDDPSGLYIGSAVENAYIGESSQVWSGCMLTKSCAEFAESNDHIEDFKSVIIAHAAGIKDKTEQEKVLQSAARITMYNVPMQRNPKEGPIEYYKESHYVLDWTIRMYENASNKAFKNSENRHAQLIQKNTIEFEKWARINNRITGTP